MKTIQLEILSPNQHVFSGPVASVVLPAALGLMGVLPGHAPFIALLSSGSVTAQAGAGSPASGHQTLSFAVSGGFAQVLPDRVTVIADPTKSAP